MSLVQNYFFLDLSTAPQYAQEFKIKKYLEYVDNNILDLRVGLSFSLSSIFKLIILKLGKSYRVRRKIANPITGTAPNA